MGQRESDVVTNGGIRCMLMRGGTSKGAYFLAEELPNDPLERDDILLRIMGSPDVRQIDGIGGAHPLTSKVAIVSANESGVDYLFLQVVVDEARVSTQQNCGNILAGVGPFAVERELVPSRDGHTTVPIRMMNTGGVATATVQIEDGAVVYDGRTRIDGVPGTAAPVIIDFDDTAGSSCGALLPTGNATDLVEGIPVTLIDNGMPVIVVAASELGISGGESPEELEASTELRRVLERLRRAAGPVMRLGDVSETTVPKITIVSEPVSGGAVRTRTFIPHRCHTSIGVLGAASVAAAVALPGTVTDDIARSAGLPRMAIEHPTGSLEVEVEVDEAQVVRTAVVRTARKLFDGRVFARPSL